MKKSILFAILAVVTLAIASCSGGSTPTKTVEKALGYLKAEKYDAYVDMVYVDPSEKDSPQIKKQKEEMAALLKEKISKNPNGKMKSFKVLSEEIIDETKANVKVEITMSDGKTEENTIKCRKDEKGDWKLDKAK